MIEVMSKSEVEQLKSLLTDKQQTFLDTYAKQSKRSKWIESLCLKRGHSFKEGDPIPSYDNWILEDMLDAGKGNRTYKCECGMPLRYQYIVYHITKDITYKLGEECLSNYTGLTPTAIKDVQESYHSIDLERDEILVKFKNKDLFNVSRYKYLFKNEKVSYYFEQVKLGLPLSSKQINKLKRLDAEHKHAKKREKVIASLTEKQSDLLQSLSNKEQKELVDKIINQEKNLIKELPGIPDQEIKDFLSNELPLLKRQKETIDDYIYNQSFSGSDVTDINKLMERHSTTLKAIRKGEANLSPKLTEEWKQVQENVKALIRGEEFNYTSFKVTIRNMCIPLRIEPDMFL
ncbi:hypothetical protein ACFC4S_24065 [Priestia megaterium]|uniref:hypothetical protein n=1 Tax=Priestia megaterium TaxID=1404 RepID=UPI001DE0C7BE|nr:hypothetical protein [Priestia megaterium]